MRSEITPEKTVEITTKRLYQLDTETPSTSNPKTFRKIDKELKKLDQIEN